MNTPQSLADLVEVAARRHGTPSRPASGLQLSEAAKKKGFKLTYTTVNHIKAGTYRYTPKPETIRALAWLADVTETVAFTAAGQPVPGPPLADELPDGADNLSPKSRRVVIEMLRVLIDLENTTDANKPDVNRPASQEDQAGPLHSKGTPDSPKRKRTQPTPSQEQGASPAPGEEQKTSIEYRLDVSPPVEPGVPPTAAQKEQMVAILQDVAKTPRLLELLDNPNESTSLGEIHPYTLWACLSWGRRAANERARTAMATIAELTGRENLAPFPGDPRDADGERWARAAPGEEQKTVAASGPPAGIDFDLAAHPDMKMAADRTDKYFDELGEGNQEQP